MSAPEPAALLIEHVGHKFGARAALDDDRVAQATLDTVTPEPLPAGHWLYEHPKVNVCAHVSWYSPALQRAAVEIFTDNLGRFIRGEPLQYIVDVSEGY